MHILWIENASHWLNNTKKQLLSKVDIVDILPGDSYNLAVEDMAMVVFEKYSAVDIFIINPHILVGSSTRIDCAGIKLLKLLRLHNLNQHCIIYSFFTREQFLQLNPQNLILFSKGISFIRLPFEFIKIPFSNLTDKTAPDDLAPFLKAEFDLPDNRHMIANWWGVLQLWKVHKAIINNETNPFDNIERLYLDHSIKEMNSFQGLLAIYLNKEKEKDLEEKLRQLQQKQAERFGVKKRSIEVIKSLLEEKTIKFDERVRKIDLLKEFIYDPNTKTLFQTVLEKLKLISDPIQEKVNRLLEAQKKTEYEVNLLKEFVDLESCIAEEKIRIEEQNKQLDFEINEEVKKLERLERFSTHDFDLSNVREKLQKACPKILYVDDQADDGWAFVLQQLIYRERNDAFSVIVPDKGYSIEQISETILDKNQKTNPDLIILDLRLKAEHGVTTNISNISGVQVLKNISEQGITCPILIFTASNKIWSFKETFFYGASAFWIKEGIDESRDLTGSIENYLHLVDLLSTLCLSDEFRFLSECKINLKNIKEKEEPFWWESNDWLPATLTYPKTRSPKRKEVTDIFQHSIQLIEDYLRMDLLESQTLTIIDQMPSLIISRLALILEIIHQTDNPYDESKTRIALSKKFEDQFGRKITSRIKLLDLRNRAVHDQNCRYSDLKAFIFQLFEYLDSFNSLIRPELKAEEPNHGGKYISEVHHGHNTFLNRFYLNNPGLELPSLRPYIILDTRTEYNPHLTATTIFRGDRIEFELSISKANPPNYYALNAKKLN